MFTQTTKAELGRLLALCIAFVLCTTIVQSTSAVIASVTGTGSAYYAYDGYNQAFGSYTSSEGAKVLQSANIPTDSFALEKELAIDTGIAVTGAVAIKGLSVAGSKVLESSTAQKVKSVLFKGEKGTNVATKTTTTKLTTSPDSSSLYESGTSTRIGISAIDSNEGKRVHEVLGGYGENISKKDSKLQVQAEKALDAHAKKTATTLVEKNSKTGIIKESVAQSTNNGKVKTTDVKGLTGKNEGTNLSNSVKGDLGEARAQATLKYADYESLPVRLPGNRGMDHVFVKYDTKGKVVDVIVNESKYAAKGGLPKLNRTVGNKVQQLSNKWLDL